MTHTPAVDSLEHIEALRALRSMFGEDRIPPPCHERDAIDAAIAALTRPPGGSERLLVSLVALHNTLLNLDDSGDLPDEITDSMIDAVHEAALAALASPQGAEQRQESEECQHDWYPLVQAINKPHGPITMDDTGIAGYENCGRMCADCGKIEPPHPAQAASQGDAVDAVKALPSLRTHYDTGRVSLTIADFEKLRIAAAFASPLSDSDGEDVSCELNIGDDLIVYGSHEAIQRAKAALSSPPGVHAAQVSDAELAWQNIETAEVEFLNNLAEKGGLADLLPGMLRHCARLVADRKKLFWALTEYPKRNPQQLQAAKVCAGVLALAAAHPSSAAHGGEDAG